jgi:hypothetical protein
LDADVLDSLAVLTRASTEFFGWLTGRGKTGGLLVAALGEEAVRVMRNGDAVKLTSVPARALAENLVAWVSGPSPAGIEAVNIRSGDLRDADGIDSLEAVRNTGARDVATVRALLAQPATGLGELYAGARDHRGYRVTEQPVRYRDTAAGRVMIYMSDEYLSVAPGTDTVLVERLRQAHRSLVG